MIDLKLNGVYREKVAAVVNGKRALMRGSWALLNRSFPTLHNIGPLISASDVRCDSDVGMSQPS